MGKKGGALALIAVGAIVFALSRGGSGEKRSAPRPEQTAFPAATVPGGQTASRSPTAAPRATKTPKATAALRLATRPSATPTPAFTVPPALAAATFRMGESSDAILQIKLKMQEYGYFRQTAELSGQYNAIMEERVRLFQRNNGLKETGLIDDAFLSALYGPMPVTTDAYGFIADASPQTVLTRAGGAEAAVTRSAPRRMTVSVSASCSNYNHVGNEWSQSFAVNGSTVRSGSVVTLQAGDQVTVSARIEEADKRPDVGTGQTSRTVTEADLANGFSLSLDVTVRENGGRYSGNTCMWRVTFSFR